MLSPAGHHVSVYSALLDGDTQGTSLTSALGPLDSLAFWEEGASKVITAEMGGGAGGRRGQLVGFQHLLSGDPSQRSPLRQSGLGGVAAKNKLPSGRSLGVASHFPTLPAVGGAQAWIVVAVGM